MKIEILAIGRLKSGPERELAARYAERFRALGKSLGLIGPDLREFSESTARRAEERAREEGEWLSAGIAPPARLVAFDETGGNLDSAQFAALIGGWRDGGAPLIRFVLGGADGLSESVRVAASQILAFGRMTLPHQLARVLVLEQLYRAATILAGHPYHRG